MTTKPTGLDKIWAETGDIVQPDDAKISQGWEPEIPPHEYENWLQNRQDTFNSHVNKFGVPEWDNATEYPLNSLANVNGILYRSRVVSNLGNNPETSLSEWSVAFWSYENPQPRNRFINSNHDIAQEFGLTATDLIPQGTSFFYKSDQWNTPNSGSTGANLNCNIITSGTSRELRLTVVDPATSTSTSNNTRFTQPFEAGFVKDLNGQNVTISVKINTNQTGALPIAITGVGSGSSRSYVTEVDVIPGENTYAVTIPMESNAVPTNSDDILGLEVHIAGCNEDTLQTSTKDSWVAGSKICATTSLQWWEITGAFVGISELQFVKGNTAPTYEPKQYNEEYADCIRYFEKVGADGSSAVLLGSGFLESTVSAKCVIHFDTKRSPPDIVYSSSTSDFSVAIAGSDLPVTSFQTSTTSTKSSELLVGTTGGTSGQGCSIFINSSVGFITIDARLT